MLHEQRDGEWSDEAFEALLARFENSGGSIGFAIKRGVAMLHDELDA